MLFIFDANFPPEFVKGLTILEKANKKRPIQIDIVFSVDFMEEAKTGKPSMDEEIIAKASQMNAVIFTHDGDFKRVKHYKPLLIQHKVGYVWFRVPKNNYRYWDIVNACITSWEELTLQISVATLPFAFEVSKQGKVSKLQF
jgi:predicted nuclease of predicted toxin-antitoxin system